MAKKKKLPITKDTIDVVRKRYVISALRRASMYWPPAAEALSNARIDRGLYQCAKCKKSFTRKEVQIDHIKPIVKLTGFTDLTEYIERMFPLASDYQILCIEHHEEKTKEENVIRKLKKQLDKSKK